MLRLRHISWAVTSECNLKCIHCFCKNTISKNNVLFEEAKKYIIDPLIKLGGTSIGFTGGEPLIRQDVYNLISYAAGKGLITSLVTNGLLIDKECVERLYKAGLRRIQISLDSPDEHINDAIRGEGVFRRITQNALSLLRRYDFYITLVATPTNDFIDRFDDYVNLALDQRVNGIYVRRFIDPEYKYINDEYVQKNFIMLKKLTEVGNALKGRIRISSGDPLKVVTDSNYKRFLGRNDVLGGCSAGLSSLAVTPEGTVILCTRLPIELGNIKKPGIMQIWRNNKTIKDVRDRTKLEGKCGKCGYYLICGGCRAMAYFKTGRLMAHDPLCAVE